MRKQKTLQQEAYEIALERGDLASDPLKADAANILIERGLLSRPAASPQEVQRSNSTLPSLRPAIPLNPAERPVSANFTNRPEQTLPLSTAIDPNATDTINGYAPWQGGLDDLVMSVGANPYALERLKKRAGDNPLLQKLTEGFLNTTTLPLFTGHAYKSEESGGHNPVVDALAGLYAGGPLAPAGFVGGMKYHQEGRDDLARDLYGLPTNAGNTFGQSALKTNADLAITAPAATAATAAATRLLPGSLKVAAPAAGLLTYLGVPALEPANRAIGAVGPALFGQEATNAYLQSEAAGRAEHPDAATLGATAGNVANFGFNPQGALDTLKRGVGPKAEIAESLLARNLPINAATVGAERASALAPLAFPAANLARSGYDYTQGKPVSPATVLSDILALGGVGHGPMQRALGGHPYFGGAEPVNPMELLNPAGGAKARRGRANTALTPTDEYTALDVPPAPVEPPGTIVPGGQTPAPTTLGEPAGTVTFAGKEYTYYPQAPESELTNESFVKDGTTYYVLKDGSVAGGVQEVPTDTTVLTEGKTRQQIEAVQPRISAPPAPEQTVPAKTSTPGVQQPQGETGLSTQTPKNEAVPQPDRYGKAVALAQERGSITQAALQRRLGLSHADSLVALDRMQQEGVIGEYQKEVGYPVVKPQASTAEAPTEPLAALPATPGTIVPGQDPPPVPEAPPATETATTEPSPYAMDAEADPIPPEDDAVLKELFGDDDEAMRALLGLSGFELREVPGGHPDQTEFEGTTPVGRKFGGIVEEHEGKWWVGFEGNQGERSYNTRDEAVSALKKQAEQYAGVGDKFYDATNYYSRAGVRTSVSNAVINSHKAVSPEEAVKLMEDDTFLGSSRNVPIAKMRELLEESVQRGELRKAANGKYEENPQPQIEEHVEDSVNIKPPTLEPHYGGQNGRELFGGTATLPDGTAFNVAVHETYESNQRGIGAKKWGYSVNGKYDGRPFRTKKAAMEAAQKQLDKQVQEQLEAEEAGTIVPGEQEIKPVYDDLEKTMKENGCL